MAHLASGNIAPGEVSRGYPAGRPAGAPVRAGSPPTAGRDPWWSDKPAVALEGNSTTKVVRTAIHDTSVGIT
ncbi:hypothetical protein [Streptomyces sp. 8N706]|uniref:hypothetical protein n=1 Tax=Streptomyces sp. 8N706 TaxID=3457416 RepID=UPI003FD4560F